jgi:hypothetical protein
MDERPDRVRWMGGEAVGDDPKPESGAFPVRGFATGSQPPLARSPEQAARAGDRCVICGHPHRTHTAGTDGAGWCDAERECECGGFQAGRAVR